MTQSREIDLTAGSQHFRQYPLDNARLARTCKMTTAQAEGIQPNKNPSEFTERKMRREYEEKVNKLLKRFHVDNECGLLPDGYSLELLRHSLNHLYFLAVCSDEADIETSDAILGLIAQACKGDIPHQYKHSDLSRVLSSGENKTLCIKGPIAISIELTPELYKSLRNATGG